MKKGQTNYDKKPPVLVFQPELLETFAKYIISKDVPTKFSTVRDTVGLLTADGQPVGQVPLFTGPISKLPIIFKGEWSENNLGEFFWRKVKCKETLPSLMHFFGLNMQMVAHCFIPNLNLQNRALFGGVILRTHSTSADIGFNILHLIRAADVYQNLLNEVGAKFSKN